MALELGKKSLSMAKSLGGSAKKFIDWNWDLNKKTPEKVLGQIYKTMLKVQEEQDIDHELAMKEQKDKDKKENDRNDALIKALTARKKPKVKKPRKKKEEKVKKEEPKKPEEKPKEKPAEKPAEKEAKDKAEKEAKTAKDKAEKEAKDKTDREAQAVKDKAEKEAKDKAEKEAKDKTDREAQAAKDKAEKEARTAKEKADKEAETAKKTAEKEQAEARKKAEEEARKKETAEPVKPPEAKPPKTEPVNKPPEVKPPPSAEKIGVGVAVTAAGVFSSPSAFSKTMMPYAEKASKALGGKIPALAILGQWAGESSNGKSVSAPFNYAGIKAGKNDKKGDYVPTEERYTDKQLEAAEKSGETLIRVLGPDDKMIKYQNGKKVEKTVDEWFGKGNWQKTKNEGKNWVQVKSYFAKFDNFDEFTDRYVKLLSNDRYKTVRESTDPGQFGRELVKSGYATQDANKYSQHIAEFAKNYNTGDSLNQSSKENAELNANLSKQQQSTTVNNVDASTTQQAPSQQKQNKQDDRSPMQKKMQGQ